MIIILMGVSGVGKTAIGQQLARELGWPFHDADSFHPPANVEKMRRGIALTDADRETWLAEIHALIEKFVTENNSAVIACSALKQSHRDRLVKNLAGVRFVYLKAGRELLETRLNGRRNHFFNPILLASQLDTLEEPRGAVTMDAAQPSAAVIARIKKELNLR
jgi:gluconokinase